MTVGVQSSRFARSAGLGRFWRSALKAVLRRFHGLCVSPPASVRALPSVRLEGKRRDVLLRPAFGVQSVVLK